MTKEKLKNILIENKCIASDEWNNENPFVNIDLDVLYDMFEKEKQQFIEWAAEWIFKHDSYAKPTELLVKHFKEDAEEQL